MDRLLTRLALSIGIVLVAAIFLMCATVCFCAALYLVIAAYMSPAAAAALTGLGALIAMGLVLLVSRSFISGQRGRRALPLASPGGASHPDAQVAQALSALVGEELGRALHEHPKSSAAIALAAGVALGVSPGLRDVILGALGTKR